MNALTLANEMVGDVGLTWVSLLSAIVYALLGFVLLIVFAVITNYIFKLKIRDELVKDNNVGMGIAIAGMAVAIAIIIAGTINS